MVFGKIEYLNLLPFHVFMKRFTKSSQQSASMHYKRGVPAQINKKFLSRRVDAAFISSISAQKFSHVNLGIVAKKDVQSVLVIPSNTNRSDVESASSNVLARILDVKGEVLIGDKALRYYLSGKSHIDLAGEWNKRFDSSFVFALLCYHKDKKIYKKIEREFLKRRVRIPRYILAQASKRTSVKEADILEYLESISYKLDAKAKLGLKKFYTLAKAT
ncbi:MAG: MqnA/MqnD/SBP family protein [Campylobacterota bacterium]|nr:MqnA/MqnD/SBP family protein [Campylobacterota bacterium]